jgi:hypothetical protein
MDKLNGKFFDSSYVFDVCLGKVSKSFFLLSLKLKSEDKKLKIKYIFLKKAIKLLDFNPFGRTTDSLLFSWEELFEMEKDNSCCHSNKNNTHTHKDENDLGVKMRIVENDIGIHSNEYSMYSQPRESLLEYNKPDGFDFSNIDASNQSDDEDKVNTLNTTENVNYIDI